MAHYADTSNYTQGEFELWDRLIEHQGETFVTARGLPFTYSIARNEMYIDRKRKSITRAAVNATYRKAVELGVVTGPKKIGTFGASYLLPIFLKLNVCSDGKDEEAKADEENRTAAQEG